MEVIDMVKKKGLGRGLDALIENLDRGLETGPMVMQAPVEAITANPRQPRTDFKAKDLKSLTDSIKDRGVLEPLLVRRSGPGEYELIAGERRLRAAREAGLATVPVILREASPQEMLELALIENLHREDLNPMEEAEAYLLLMEDFGRNHEEIARLAGRDRSTVANLIRLLQLPEPVQEDVHQGRLTAGHARAFLSLGEADLILTARREVLAGSLSVRQTEGLVKKMLAAPKPRKKADPAAEVYYERLAEEIGRALEAKVRIVQKANKGRLEINFKSARELETLMTAMGVRPLG